MSGIQQMLTGGTYKAPGPTTIGQAFGGGFYAGKISTTANGVATHYLIVAPKASGETSGKTWGPTGTTTGQTSLIDGPTNTATEAALGSTYEAATFCNDLNAGAGLNGYKDWYLPAINELEVLYYFLKPTTDANSTSYGANVNAVSPEPYNTNYTTSDPTQTSATGTDGFRAGETNAFAASTTSIRYWSSSEGTFQGYQYAEEKAFIQGYDGDRGKTVTNYVRAVRRVPV